MMVYFCNALISSSVKLIGSDSLAFLGGDLFCFGELDLSLCGGDLGLGFARTFGELALNGDLRLDGSAGLGLSAAFGLGAAAGFGLGGELRFGGGGGGRRRVGFGLGDRTRLLAGIRVGPTAGRGGATRFLVGLRFGPTAGRGGGIFSFIMINL